MRPRPHFKAGAGGQQRSSGRKLSTPGGSATTNYSMTCLERLIRTHPIWFLPKLNRDEASEFLTGKGSGVRHSARTTDTQRELFSKNLKLLGLGRDFGLKIFEAFGVFLAGLSAPILVL